jgi:hypothetical protein
MLEITFLSHNYTIVLLMWQFQPTPSQSFFFLNKKREINAFLVFVV